MSKTTDQVQVKKPSVQDLPIWVKLITGGIAGCTAEFFTIPVDTMKVRLQIQGEKLSAADAKAQYRGTFDCLKQVVKNEGFFALWSGLNAGFQRQLIFGSFRLGMYEPIRNMLSFGRDNQDTSIFTKILAGVITGGLGMVLGNPTDLVKIRMQAQGRLAKELRRYSGVMDAYSKIYRTEGLLSFWTGIIPNIIRNSIINTSEVATFDQVKESLIHHHLMDDNIWCYLVSSCCSGLMATICGSPADVIKTRMMNANKAKGQAYNGVLDCIIRTFKDEGILAFYKGFVANAQRLISWNIVCFVTLSEIRNFAKEKLYH